MSNVRLHKELMGSASSTQIQIKNIFLSAESFSKIWKKRTFEINFSKQESKRRVIYFTTSS